KGEVPSLAKEGWPRHQVNGPVPLEARPGWFVPLPIIGGLNQPPRLRPRRRLRGIFLMGAATPPFPRRGLRLSLQLFSMPRVLPRSIQSCPAGQLHNRKEVGGTKTKNLSAYFLERGVGFQPHVRQQRNAYTSQGFMPALGATESTVTRH